MPGPLLTLLAARLRAGLTLACRNGGNISFGAVIGGLLLVISYLSFPDMFHDFVRYVIDYVFDALHGAFGGDPPKGTQTDKGTGN